MPCGTSDLGFGVMQAQLGGTVGSPRVVSLGPPGLVADAGVDATYDGGVDPNPGTDVGLGVEGRPFTLPAGVGVSCGRWMAESWDRDARRRSP